MVLIIWVIYCEQLALRPWYHGIRNKYEELPQGLSALAHR